MTSTLTPAQLTLVQQSRCFSGWQKRYRHDSASTKSPMQFAIYLPPQAENKAVPVLYWLSGLTCTEENFIWKAGAQRIAAELGMAIVCPDTSPRDTGIAGEADDWNIGAGAGFYLNATEAPWNAHYQMYDYVVKELPELIKANFPVTDRWSISGHSMGGHGAITIALKNPGMFCSLSAFAPVSNPTVTEKGRWRFTQYLGDNPASWEEYDACKLIAKAEEKLPLLVDQGENDEMIDGLLPENLRAACEQHNYPLTLRMQPGYDHGYYFVSTFIEDHLRYHADVLFERSALI